MYILPIKLLQLEINLNKENNCITDNRHESGNSKGSLLPFCASLLNEQGRGNP
jgi:hypothetical protein